MIHVAVVIRFPEGSAWYFKPYFLKELMFVKPNISALPLEAMWITVVHWCTAFIVKVLCGKALTSLSSYWRCEMETGFLSNRYVDVRLWSVKLLLLISYWYLVNHVLVLIRTSSEWYKINKYISSNSMWSLSFITASNNSTILIIELL